ncbi:hypothetical protein [Catellatospora methionotrophica]|uniref:hypothetical protein n=1 Tax=Catellatospora methionotrophica TaxID=121620 RepID=UPI0033D17814
MTETKFNPTSLAATLAEIQRGKAADEVAVAKSEAEAEQARSAAAERAQVAELAAREADSRTRTAFAEMLRTLTAEVHTARAAAVDAVRSGGGDVLPLWAAYHRVRATNKARWEALSYEVKRTTGHDPIPGSWGLPLFHPTGHEETFADFVTAEMYKVVREIAEQTSAEVHDQLDETRRAAEAEAEAQAARVETARTAAPTSRKR